MGVKADKFISRADSSSHYIYKKSRASSFTEWHDCTRYRQNTISLFDTYTSSYPASSRSDSLVWIKDGLITTPACNKMVILCNKFLKEKSWSTWSSTDVVDSLLHMAIKSPIIDGSPIDVVYKNRGLIEVSLTSHNKLTLNKVIKLIRITSQKDNWPLNRLEIQLVDDSEVEGWQYILIMIYFNSDFDTADKYIRNFYNALDMFTNTLDNIEKDMLQRRIFFDVGITISDD